MSLKKRFLPAAMLLATISAPALAVTYDMRTFFEAADFSQPQAAGSMWTARFGSASGVLLPPAGSYYGYGAPTYAWLGGLWNAGTAGSAPGYDATFNGLFLHPGNTAAESTALLFSATSPLTVSNFMVDLELVAGGGGSNGVDVAVRHVRGGVSTPLASYVVAGPARSQQTFTLGGLAFATGDFIEVDVGSAGSFQFDHVNVNLVANAVPVPEPGTWALMAGGLALLVVRRLRA